MLYPAAGAGLLDLLARRGAAAPRRQAAPDRPERLDDDRRRGRLPRSELLDAAAHHPHRHAPLQPRGDDRRAAAGGLSRCSASRLAPDHEISRVIRGGWQMAGGHGAVDARRRGRGHGRLRRRRHHHLRLRRHLHRRRGADRRLPRALSPTLRGAEALARDQGPHQVRARPRPAAAADPRRCGGDHRPLAAPARRPSGSTSCSSTGGTTPSPAGSRRRTGSTSCARAGKIRPPRRHQLRHRAHGRDRRRRACRSSRCRCSIRCSTAARRRRCARPPPRAGVVAPLLRHRRGRLPRRPLARAARAGRAAREPLAHQVQAHHRRFRRLGPVPGAARGAARRRRPPRQRHRHGRERGDARPAGGRGGDRRRAQPRAPRGEPRDRRPRARRGGHRGDRRGARRGARRSTATSTRSSATAPGATGRS